MKNTYIVIFITFCLFISCKQRKQAVETISADNINVNAQYEADTAISEFIKPYHDHIQDDLNKILAYNPTDLLKEEGELSYPIGNFMADATYQQADKVFFQRTGKHIDFVLLNWGGIRSNLPKGDITTRSAYNLMPFENKIVVLALKGSKIKELATYLIQEKKPHPLSEGFELVIDEKSNIKSFTVNGKPVEDDQIYYVGTNDYLMNGGDRMVFLTNAEEVTELDYLLRNALIDYFQSIDTLKVKSDKRFLMKK